MAKKGRAALVAAVLLLAAAATGTDAARAAPPAKAAPDAVAGSKGDNNNRQAVSSSHKNTKKAAAKAAATVKQSSVAAPPVLVAADAGTTGPSPVVVVVSASASSPSLLAPPLVSCADDKATWDSFVVTVCSDKQADAPDNTTAGTPYGVKLSWSSVEGLVARGGWEAVEAEAEDAAKDDDAIEDPVCTVDLPALILTADGACQDVALTQWLKDDTRANASSVAALPRKCLLPPGPTADVAVRASALGGGAIGAASSPLRLQSDWSEGAWCGSRGSCAVKALDEVEVVVAAASPSPAPLGLIFEVASPSPSPAIVESPSPSPAVVVESPSPSPAVVVQSPSPSPAAVIVESPSPSPAAAVVESPSPSPALPPAAPIEPPAAPVQPETPPPAPPVEPVTPPPAPPVEPVTPPSAPLADCAGNCLFGAPTCDSLGFLCGNYGFPDGCPVVVIPNTVCPSGSICCSPTAAAPAPAPAPTPAPDNITPPPSDNDPLLPPCLGACAPTATECASPTFSFLCQLSSLPDGCPIIAIGGTDCALTGEVCCTAPASPER
jgi:hypothetical protein